MQVFTLGMPAIGPLSALSWQSAHTAFLAMWVLCGNGIGWTAAGRIAKKSRAASAVVRWAGLKTDEDTCAGCGEPHAAVKSETSAKSRRRRANSFGRAPSPEP